MRHALIILPFILYTMTFAYLSSPIITEAAGRGIITGGLVVLRAVPGTGTRAGLSGICAGCRQRNCLRGTGR